MSTGINIGDAAMARWSEDRISQFGESGPNIEQAVAGLDGLTGTKAELLEAIAYLALQVQAYRRMSNQDAALAVLNIESIVTEYRRRRHD